LLRWPERSSFKTPLKPDKSCAMVAPADVTARHKEDMMPTGTVKFFNTNKGFGFIQPDDGGKDVFVHITAVEQAGMGSLVEGQKVRYEVVTERGKTAASNLAQA
jgi:cold shock protein